MEWDILVIGAGPAGMSAALEALRFDLRVIVIDRQQEAGGQIFRQVGSAPEQALSSLGKDYTRGKKLVEDFMTSGAVFQPETQLWHIVPGMAYVRTPEGCSVIRARHIIIATGGMERPAPVSGWTKPGVLGVGAADTLLKSSGTLPDGPVIICGNGPLILQAVEHFNMFKIPVAGVVLTSSTSAPVKALLKAYHSFSRPLYALHGANLGIKMLLRNKIFTNASSLAISGEEGDFTLSFEQGAKRRTLKGAAVLLHEGVVPETRITRLARMRHIWDEQQRYWHAESSIWGDTNVNGISVAGDCAGVLGADAAMASGHLSGLEAAKLLGRLTVAERAKQGASALGIYRRCLSMQEYTGAIFTPRLSAVDIPDDATVCRCEGLTAGELRKWISAGCWSLDALKAQSRCGMGTCQGRMCSPAAAELIANAYGIPLEALPQYHAQFPLTPVSFGELADMHMPPSTL